LALLALHRHWRYALAVVWFFNLFGCADLLSNVAQGVRLNAAPHLLAAWFVPAFVVPAMLLSHLLIFKRLWRLGLRGELGD
jgi:hypothetical protein